MELNINNKYSCENWNTIQKTIIKASFDYLDNYNQTDEEIEKYMQIIQYSLARIFANESVVKNFMKACQQPQVINALFKFDIYGLYVLCNKDHNEPYSVGNSLDIYELIHIIKPYLMKYPEYESIIEIEKLFLESIDKKQKIYIL